MNRVSEVSVILNYQHAISDEVNRLFRKDEAARALTVVIAALCNDNPVQYIEDVLAQCRLPYMEWLELTERYKLLMVHVDLGYDDFLRKVRNSHADTIAVRDLCIRERDLIFVLQSIYLESEYDKTA